MTNEDTFTKLVDKIVKACKEEYKVLEKFIDEIEEFSLPHYDELKDPEVFIHFSRQYTQLSTTTHFHKVKVGKMMIDISTMLNELSKYQINSLYQKYINDLKASRDKCQQYTSVLEEHQKSINQAIDYLKMYSYTVNTPYVV